MLRLKTRALKCHSSCYSSIRVLGAFRVGWCRSATQAVLWHITAIFEKDGKTLKRNGGDDGARTRDLRRDRPAF
jgi:hypothetical protein